VNHRYLLLSILAFALAACSARQDLADEVEDGDPPTEPIHLTFLALNDFHGGLLDRPVTSTDDSPREGGAAMLSAYAAAVRAENPGGTVIVDAGDMLQGPLLCNHFEGAPVADVYRHLGVTAAALGNHEFDYGPVGPRSLAGPDDDLHGALAAFMERADLPILAANVRVADGGRPLPAGVRPHMVIEAQGVKVGLIGLSTTSTPSQTVRQNVDGLIFDPVGPALAQAVTEVRAEGAEVIVVVAHLDGGCAGDRRWPPAEVCTPEKELIELLDGAGGEVDAVFMGHRHSFIADVLDGVALAEGGSKGRGMSRVDLYVDPVTRRVDRSRTGILPPLAACEMQPATGDNCYSYDAEGPWTPAMYNGRPVPPDTEVDAILAPYVEEIRQMCAETLVRAEVPIERAASKGLGESAAGNLVVDAMLAGYEGADVALCNSGALRTDLPAGDLSYCALFALFPFDNRVVEVRLIGSELTELLRIATSGAHSNPQAAGVRLVVDRGEGEARDTDGDGEFEDWERDRLLEARVDGQPIAQDREYRVLLPDYLYGRPDMQELLGGLPEDRSLRHPDKVRDVLVLHVRGLEAALGADGGWPLPQADDPRIRKP